MPRSRRRSSLARRSASRSDSSVTRAAYSRLRRQVAAASGRLGSLDLRDLELLLRAARCLHRHDLVPLAADQRLADRRLVRELVLDRVRLGGSDDLELLRLAGLLVLDVDHGADANRLGVDLLVVDDRGPAQAVLKRSDPLLEHGLLVLRVVVFGVFSDVPELPRLLDAIRNLAALVVLQVLELLLELFEPLGGDQCLARQLSSIPSVCGI